MSKNKRGEGVSEEPRSFSHLYDVWRRFKKNKASIIGAIIVFFIMGMGVFAPVIAPYDPNRLFYGEELMPPSTKFPLGTDSIGRDVFSYVLWGARTSLYVATAAVIIEVIIGFVIGALSGYLGGVVDEVCMRFTDVIMTLPTFILLIVAVSMFRVRSENIIILVMAFLNWPWLARVIRTEFLSLKQLPFVEAAKSMGASGFRIIFRHILPNALSPIIVLAATDSSFFILYEATLAFLGLGDPTAVSWGVMVSRGKNVLRTAWWVTTFPGILIFLICLGFNLLGDGIRDAFDVKTKL